MAPVLRIDRGAEGMGVYPFRAKLGGSSFSNRTVLTSTIGIRTNVMDQDRRPELTDSAGMGQAQAAARTGDEHGSPFEIWFCQHGILRCGEDGYVAMILPILSKLADLLPVDSAVISSLCSGFGPLLTVCDTPAG
ncbi:hypothetical protein [Rhodovulum sulfidophilum]|uniref:Uncharacterized protein n=1 Tax=Rhodovulum sulfidophilum TaxID=35806 RepID=A0ABS1RZ84_RHOSU|nr:hypothetical protein [Rhodovulum sulfidophilum]MBL3611233.1 hypothetical protein [Rhodovulum sulfidophilum]MCE8456916.1 hypothetical protein [Rhodovulum sulfidophilum]